MSDNNAFFRDAAERLFTTHGDTKDVEAAEHGQFPETLWAAMRDAGLLDMLASEAAGGIGASISEAAAILRVAGKWAAPGPILETMLGKHLIGLAGHHAQVNAVTVRFDEQDDAGVAWPNDVGAIVSIARDGGGVAISVDTPDAFFARPMCDTIGEPRAILVREKASCAPIRLEMHYETLFGQAAILNAARCLGALDWIRDRTVAYAFERRQFGREIGKLQVIQQYLAELAGSIAAAAAIVDAASALPDSLPLVAASRVRLGDTIDTAVAISHQVHGAIGFSREYPLNYRTRRLMAWRDFYGNTVFWRRELAGRMTAPSRTLWSQITAASATV